MLLIDIDSISSIPIDFPTEFILFCKNNQITIPKTNSGRGKALLAMINNINFYWTRRETDIFCKKFFIKTTDSIQLFNKFEQIGLKTNSGIETGKLYIRFPYEISNKFKMRKDIKILNIDKKELVDNIKKTIIDDYINIDYTKWQLGHKNPEIEDNKESNLVLQPPIQSKYRDKYIFIDTLTKIPCPSELKRILKSKKVILSEEQIKNYIMVFQELLIE